jgi:hypothetical protein
MRYLILFGVVITTFWSCNNLEDASLANRKTFVKLYDEAYNISATAIEETQNGYVILGNRLIDLADTSYLQTVLLEVDRNGNPVGDFHFYDGGTGKSFKYVEHDAFTGYVIVGDSIYVDPTEEQAANVTISSMRILIVNTDFTEGKKVRPITDRVPISESHPVKIDFFGGATNLTDNGVVFLGSYKEGVINQLNAPEKQLVFSVDFSLDSAWFKTYDLIGLTNSNSKSIHYNNGHILWATSVLDVQGDFTSSYITVPYAAEASEIENNSGIGLTTIQSFIVKDIQPASSTAFGYGVIGTYSQATDGSEGNMFFFRVLPDGNIVTGSDRYFDGIESFKPDSLDIHKNTSSIVDEGEAICATQDGGFILAGSFTTNPQKGKGGKDIFLIKINYLGNMVWAKTYGAGGDETVSTVRETANGSILVCGTNNLGDYSSIFLMKIDNNGELKR